MPKPKTEAEHQQLSYKFVNCRIDVRMIQMVFMKATNLPKRRIITASAPRMGRGFPFVDQVWEREAEVRRRAKEIVDRMP